MVLNKYDLIAKYQDNDKESGEKLLEEFEGFIFTFANLLYYGKYDLSNTGVRNFLNLLTESNENNIKEIEKIIKIINEKYSSFDYLDVYHDVQLSFLIALKAFNLSMFNEQEHITDPFEYFLSIYFCYILKRNTVDKIINTPLYREYVDKWPMDIPKLVAVEKDVFKTEIDNDWVEGRTCSEEFLSLSNDERFLLKQYYVDELTLEEIAKIRDKGTTGIFKNLKKIKNKIKKFKERNEENLYIVSEYKKGKTIKEIGKEINKSYSTVYRRLIDYISEG